MNGSIIALRDAAVQDRLDSAAEYQAIAVRSDAEQTARQGAVNDLNFVLQEESGSRVSTDNALESKVDDEKKVREADVSRIDTTVFNNFDTINGRVTGEINTLDGKVTTETKAREDADALKFDKTGGNVSGDITLVDSYLNFGLNWRVKASGDGSKIVFQHMKADRVWRTAIPFICAV